MLAHVLLLASAILTPLVPRATSVTSIVIIILERN